MGDYTSPQDERFFGAIGRLAISWAHLEFGLDCMVEILYRSFDGKSIEPEMPRALSKKISFLRAAFRRLPIGDEAINGYIGLLDSIQAAATTRHDLIHGVMVEQVEQSGEATMVRLLREKKGVVKKPITATTKSILEAAIEAQQLGGKVLHWVNVTLDLLHELSKQGDGRKPS
jgi:hypothetical protein